MTNGSNPSQQPQNQPASPPSFMPYSYFPQGYPMQQQPAQQPGQSFPAQLPTEESYIENILRMNRGKTATVYMTFENNREWNAKIFKGTIETAGRDHLILSDPKTGTRYLLPMIYLDYVTFDGEIQYSYPYSMANYPPR